MDKNDLGNGFDRRPLSSAESQRSLLAMLLSGMASIGLLALWIAPRLRIMDQMIVDMNIEAPQRINLLQGLNHYWNIAILIYSSLTLLLALALTLAISNKSELRKATAVYILTLTLPIAALHLTLSLGFTFQATARDGPCTRCHCSW